MPPGMCSDTMKFPPVLCSSLLPSQTSNAWGVSCAVTVARGANMKWARTFLATGHTTDHANITRMLPDLQKPCKRSALHACKQSQLRRKAKRVDVREKRSNPKGEKDKEREIHAAVEPRAELQRADETKSMGENKIHVTSETVSPNANMGSRKDLCKG
mgnify:CR=1 FL=1